MVIIPTGCTEQQGPHSTVDFDIWLATELSFEAAELAYRDHGVKALVLPTIPFGPTPEHRNYGYGYIDIPQKVYDPTHASKELGEKLWKGSVEAIAANLCEIAGRSSEITLAAAFKV